MASAKATFFKWRSKYGGASVSDVKRVRELEVENAKLQTDVADLALENLHPLVGERGSIEDVSRSRDRLQARG